MKLFILIFLVLTLNVSGQVNSICECQGFVDLSYKGFILLLDKPNGKEINRLRHNFKTEDFLVFDIDSVIGNYFHVKLQHSVIGIPNEGWVFKSKQLMTFVKNYSSSIQLYSKPNKSSNIRATISKNLSNTYQIIDCKQKWLKIKGINPQSKTEGWLKSTDQCANPYTSCS